MAKQRAKSEAAVREAQLALRALADAVHAGAKDSDLPKKLRKALRDVEPLLERADRKLGKRQAKLARAARKEREQRAAAAKAEPKAKDRAAAEPNAKDRAAAEPKATDRAAAEPDAAKKPSSAKASSAKASAHSPRRQGPGTTPRTSIAGARARKRARRGGDLPEVGFGSVVTV